MQGDAAGLPLLFSVGEAGEEFVLNGGKPAPFFLGSDRPDQESRVARKVAHRLQPFKILFHILC